MTGADLKSIRETRLQIGPQALAALLIMGQAGAREIDALERTPAKQIPGPMAVAVQALADGWRPAHLRAGCELRLAA